MIFLNKAKAEDIKKLEGTVLALDWGLKRIGWATADREGIAITPRGTLHREKIKGKNPWVLRESDIKALKELKEQWEIEHWVLGWPVNKGGIESEASRNCSQMAQELEEILGGEMALVDESLTSWEQGNAANVDAGAAATLLEDFFEQRKRKQQSLKNKSGNISLILLACFAILVCVLGFFGKFYYDFAKRPISNTDPSNPPSLVFDVKPGSSFSSIRLELETELNTRINPLAFKIWSHLRLANKKLRIGEYRIQRSWSAARVFEEILSGSPLLYKVVVKEGYNKWDIIQAFKDSHENQDPATLEKELNDTKYLKTLDFLKTQTKQPASLEGFLFPETYSYQKYDSPRKLVESMLEQFKKRALPILEQHPWSKQPGGLYRLLILASIVEKESGQKEEQPLIASVFWNRLAKRMKLQSDPTTIYGLLPAFDGNLTKTHLVTPSAWNTYTLPELPVSPISNPGETALSAVVHPASTDYLYFVAKNDGTHAFAADYKKHSANVDEYQKRKRSADKKID